MYLEPFPGSSGGKLQWSVWGDWLRKLVQLCWVDDIFEVGREVVVHFCWGDDQANSTGQRSKMKDCTAWNSYSEWVCILADLAIYNGYRKASNYDESYISYLDLASPQRAKVLQQPI